MASRARTRLGRTGAQGIARQPNDPNRLYVGTEIGVFSTTDGGATWAAANEGPANVAVDELVFMSKSTVLLAATHGRGLWTAETCATGIIGPVGRSLKLTKVSAGTARASWADAAGATRHVVFAEPDAKGPWRDIDIQATSGAPGVDLALPAGTAYYRVAGASDCGVGPP